MGFGSVWLKSISFGLFVKFAFERSRFGLHNNLSSFECFCEFDLDGAKLCLSILDCDLEGPKNNVIFYVVKIYCDLWGPKKCGYF